MKSLKYPAGAAVLLLFCAVAVGCASTKKRYEKGLRAEEEGRFAEASELYIQVLRKEPDWEDARSRLGRVGQLAAEAYIADSETAEAAGRYVAAADLLASAVSLQFRAAAVGVDLELPGGVDERGDRLETMAVRELVRDAERARDRGDWSRSLSLYDRALQRGGASSADAERINDARARVLAAWSADALQEGRYRLAFDKAEQVLSMVGRDDALAEEAMELQQEALARGSRRVAVLPVGSTEQAGRAATRLVLTDVNDVLVYDYWSQPPLFVLVADPVVVRREMRRIVGRAGRVVTSREAVDVGRTVDADWVVAADLVAFDRIEREKDASVRKARTRGRGGRDTTYVLREMKVRYESRVEIRIHDVVGGGRLYQGTIDAAVEDRFERGDYPGDHRDLDLSGSELAYFDSEEIRLDYERLEQALADQMAQKVAERVYSRLSGMIP